MNKKILFGLIIVLLLFVGCGKSNNLDSQNEKILEKVLELEEIDVNKVKINKDTVFVSIEVSNANEHDSQLIEWWGNIFGISSLLKGDYIFVIIENTVNQEPYTYVSSNIYSIRDFSEFTITDVEFWQESLITSEMPNNIDILEASNLPKDTLTDEKGFKMGLKFEIAGFDLSFLIKYLIIGIIIIIVGILLILGIKKRHKIKHVYSKTKKYREKLHKMYKEKIVPKTKQFAKNTKKHAKILANKTKKTYNEKIVPKAKEYNTKLKKTYNEKIVPKAKEFNETAKKKTKELMEKTKNKSVKK
jgi:hypothetical protein